MIQVQHFSTISVLICITIVTPSSTNAQQVSSMPHVIVEAYPNKVQALIESHERQLAAAVQHVKSAPFYLIVPSINRWEPGSTIRVAFNGGDASLYAKIEDAANEWINAGTNIKFQFKDLSGKYLQWSSADRQYRADIRVAFFSGDNGGYWSYVGRDSINESVSGPNETSLNLESFDKNLPNDWRAIVMHEFGHALGFQHEHQNPVGGCDFRFDDDPGYVLTKDQDGWYATDANGRRPGLYTYLGGYANYWPKAKVDDNLRALSVSSAFLVGAFDKSSIMKYFFGAFMFVGGDRSPCYTSSENLSLSDQDKEGARRAYPRDAPAMAAIIAQKKQVLSEILASPNASKAILTNTKLHLENLK